MNPTDDVSHVDWRDTWAYLIGMQAYAYGFPAIYYTKLRFGMVKQPRGVVDTPLNTLFHVPRLSDHNDQIGGSPMRDAIYSVAWLDLRAEPVVIHSPDSAQRYVSIQLAEFYSDLFGTSAPASMAGARRRHWSLARSGRAKRRSTSTPCCAHPRRRRFWWRGCPRRAAMIFPRHVNCRNAAGSSRCLRGSRDGRPPRCATCWCRLRPICHWPTSAP